MIYSPLEQFEIVSLISLTAPVLGNFVLALTNLGFYTILTVTLVLGLHYMADNNQRLIPSRWSVVIESIYASIHSMVRAQIGANYEFYMPFIYSLFIYVLIANLLGNIPYGYTIATSGVASIGISMFVFIGVTILGLEKHRLHFFSFFVPGGTPLPLVPALTLIETVSYLARSLSLGVRLFSNMTAGHTLLNILSTFLAKLFSTSILVAIITIIPFVVFVALIGLEMAVSLIQSYVLVVLVCSYLKDANLLHL